ncbi:MAG: hypothetical protein JL50_18480 [Peptococcaceae bacterium BICA1-7]|nr:MAG: hypothetical protein JL50_18480 [Peptococcaceae bacterium BICA1-7]HBV99079.1 hypothetical protein [Desulfotomaculum sp.]
MTRPIPVNDQDLQILMNDIVRGARAKMVEPVISENRKLGDLVEELHGKNQRELEAIRERLERLEEAVRATPVILLNAIREAINQAGMGGKL